MKKIYGAHPLLCFNDTLYNLAQYQAFTFVVDEDAPPFNQLLPGLPNASVRLAKSWKEKYHALCVLSGNFSCLLWQKILATFEDEFHIPAQVAYPYLTQQMQNIMTNYRSALTGPLVRDDKVTIEKNIAALANDPYQKIYESFVSCYQQLKVEV